MIAHLLPIFKPRALFDASADPSQCSHSEAPPSKIPQPPARVAKEAPKLKHTASNSSLGSVGTAAPTLNHTASNPSLRAVSSASAPSQLKHNASNSSLRGSGLGMQSQLKHTASHRSLGMPTRKETASNSSLGLASTSTAVPSQRNTAASACSLGSAPASRPGSSLMTASATSVVGREAAAGTVSQPDVRQLGMEAMYGTAPTTELGHATDATLGAEASASAATQKEANRRSACEYLAESDASAAPIIPAAAPPPLWISTTGDALVSCATEGSDSLAPAVAPTTTTPKGVRPPVPLFCQTPTPSPVPPDPCLTLRGIRLTEKSAEDNYEISEQGGDSDAEESQAMDRSHKHVPKWCKSYLEELQRQSDIDPDTIFGNKVPRCVLEDIFTNGLYRQVGKNRPKRARGSSGDWGKDKLVQCEVDHYKSKMGHKRSWSKERARVASRNDHAGA